MKASLDPGACIAQGAVVERDALVAEPFALRGDPQVGLTCDESIWLPMANSGATGPAL